MLCTKIKRCRAQSDEQGKQCHCPHEFTFQQRAVIQSPSRVQLFATPWTAAHQASLSLTISRSSCPSSHPLHQWCHQAISSYDALFSFCPQSFPASVTFPMSLLFLRGDQNTGASASVSVLQWIFQGWFPLRRIVLLAVQVPLRSLLSTHTQLSFLVLKGFGKPLLNFFSSSFIDIVGIQHCISLRCTA